MKCIIFNMEMLSLNVIYDLGIPKHVLLLLVVWQRWNCNKKRA